MNRLYRLLAFGYFPKEMPPVFWTGSFAAAAAKHAASLHPKLGNDWSRPFNYVLQQRVGYRRKLSAPNPNAMFWLASEIATNHTALRAHLASSKLALSSPRYNRKTKFFRAVGPDITGDERRLRRLALRANHPLVVKFDVKNFYRSIYTHSLDWALVGKAAAKASARARSAKRFPSTLDTFVRMGQDGQTLGLPIGPDTSFLLAEGLLAAIDVKLGFRPREALRFYDDFEVGVASERDADEAIERAEAVLSEFELELNPQKCVTVTGSDDLDVPWRLRLKMVTREPPRKTEDLVDLLAFSSGLAKENPDAFVLGYFIGRMRKFVLPSGMWPAWQQALLACGFAEYGVLRNVYEQLDLYERIGYPLDKPALKDFLNRKASMELRRPVSSELSWVLFGFMKFGLKPDPALIEQVLSRRDNAARILAVSISVDRCINVRKAVAELLKQMQPYDALSENWLILWELHQNGWTKDKTLASVLSKDPMFRFLASENISFLRKPAVDLLEVPAAFEEAIERAHGKSEGKRLHAEIEKTFSDLRPAGEQPLATEEEAETESVY